MPEMAPKRASSESAPPSWRKRPASATTSLDFSAGQPRHAGSSTLVQVRAAGGSEYFGSGEAPAHGGWGASANAGSILNKGAMTMALTAKAAQEEIKNITTR